MRPTVTMTVFGIFAEMTTPTFVLRRKRRQPVASPSAGAAVFWTVAAVRLRTVTALRAETAAAAAFVPAVFGAAAAFACAIAFVVTRFVAGAFFSTVSVAGAFFSAAAVARTAVFSSPAPAREDGRAGFSAVFSAVLVAAFFV